LGRRFGLPWQELGDGTEIFIYVGAPGAAQTNGLSRYGAQMEPPTPLGFGASHEVAVAVDDGTAMLSLAAEGGGWEELQPLEEVALSGTTLEMVVPFEALGDLGTGDRLAFVAVVGQQERDIDVFPSVGPAQVVMLELHPIAALLTVGDPEGDDHGPGSYTYPTDPVFDPGCFDLREFVVGTDEENIVFAFTFAGDNQGEFTPNPF